MRISFHDWTDPAAAQRTAAAPGREEVQVWNATIPVDGVDLTYFSRLLSVDERARARRFEATAARRQFVLGRALLRQLLGICLHVEPARLVFSYQSGGKPCLARSSVSADLRFNLSHSRSRVAIALARGRDVGVDIEWMDPATDCPLLAGRIFSPRDLCAWQALTEPQQPAAFFHAWTRKEAYLKAIGEGLTDALPAIEVTFAPGIEPELRGLPGASETAHQWAIRIMPLPPDYAGAVVFAENQ